MHIVNVHYIAITNLKNAKKRAYVPLLFYLLACKNSNSPANTGGEEKEFRRNISENSCREGWIWRGRDFWRAPVTFARSLKLVSRI